ncbi:dihydrofolate reductase family protein [Nakamurella endophytica]|uniref:Deaminase n=1 Tax=Nakamurella endophytica TaxID=1748367 RepID=A0A917WCE3_9ACTN|nr:dihydrofolate reductase family protein [Nakamurella endophytica]GGL94034.1 deaminase [Nakamurella endophytica]
MGRLIYSALASLDGYVEDAGGGFDWAAPDGEVHGFVNDLERPIGTYLYGRRLYDTMRFWETANADPAGADPEQDYARIWQAADKVVYSRSLAAPATRRTRVERRFDPDAVRRLLQTSAGDVSIGGAELAGQALAAGLVDECHVFLSPVAVGGGKPVFPLGVRVDLDLLDQRRFRGGTVYLRYAVRRPDGAASS